MMWIVIMVAISYTIFINKHKTLDQLLQNIFYTKKGML